MKPNLNQLESYIKIKTRKKLNGYKYKDNAIYNHE